MLKQIKAFGRGFSEGMNEQKEKEVQRLAEKQEVEAKMGWLERQYAQTNLLLLIGAPLLLGPFLPIMVVISSIVMFRSGPPVRSRAATVLLVHLAILVAGSIALALSPRQ